METEYTQDKFNYINMPESLLEKYQDNQLDNNSDDGEKERKDFIQGIHSYDILRNPKYYEAFQYLSADQDDREKIIQDGDMDETNDIAQSDLIKLVLDLPYMSDL